MREIGGDWEREAAHLLDAARGSAKLAIAMARLRLPVRAARQRLAAVSGSLRRALDGG